MLDWLTDIYTYVENAVNVSGEALDTLVTNIDAVQFGEDIIVTTLLSNIRYIAGNPLYIMLMLIFEIGAAMILWKFTKIIINTITGVMPGLKGRIKVE